MSQQIFNKHWPLAKNGANELIPGAAILQTRDDKDEPITLAAAVQWDESSGLFLPTHKENPLEVRVRELEAKLDELKQTIESGVQLKGQLQIMDRIAGIVHELGQGETYKTERPLNASMIQSDIATIVVSGRANAKRDIDVYVSMKPLYSHETERMLVYSSLEDAVPQATHVFNIVLQYPEFYLHVTNRSSSTFVIQNISLVGRGVK